MIEYLRKFENHMAFKLVELNIDSYHQIYQFAVIYFDFGPIYFGPLWSKAIFRVHCPFIEKSVVIAICFHYKDHTFAMNN